MGLFQVHVRISNPSAMDRFFESDFWVDTGAIYSFVPAGRLEEIGIQHHGERNLVLADGRTDRRRIGTAVFYIQGFEEKVPCPVIFGPADGLHLLGATALENFGLGADPTTRRLRPILSVIGGFLGSL
jgi:predicted aspartyl protease